MPVRNGGRGTYGPLWVSSVTTGAIRNVMYGRVGRTVSACGASFDQDVRWLLAMRLEWQAESLEP